MAKAAASSRNIRRQRELVNSVLSNHESRFGEWLEELSAKISEHSRKSANDVEIHVTDVAA
jgi:hypothetical protein